jgi:hypothetical protein
MVSGNKPRWAQALSAIPLMALVSKASVLESWEPEILLGKVDNT